MEDKPDNLLQLISDIDFNQLYRETEQFLTNHGFQEVAIDGNEHSLARAHRFYILNNPDGEPHIGKSYVFLLSIQLPDYKFAVNLKEADTLILIQGLAYEPSFMPLHLCRKKQEFENLVDKGFIKVYSRLDAVRALVKSIRVKESIAEAKGAYEVLEHLSCDIDLD